jgi:large subunit ribosomal protein L29
MKASEIRDMTADELRRKVADLKQELFNLRLQLEVGQLENKARIRQTKQDIARLMTVIRETNPKPQPAKA